MLSNILFIKVLRIVYTRKHNDRGVIIYVDNIIEYLSIFLFVIIVPN